MGEGSSPNFSGSLSLPQLCPRNMAMYYYARKLQKSEKKYKALTTTSISTVNGSNSTCSSNGSPSCVGAGGGGCGGGGGAPETTTVVLPHQPQENLFPSNSQSSQVQRGPNVKPANDWDHALVYQDSNLVSGTLEALIQHLVPTETYYPDRAFIFAFLLSSRLYIRPHELLGRVFRLAITTPTHSPKYVIPRASNVPNLVKLLGEWTEMFPYDFRDEQMMAHVRTITQKCVADCPPIRLEVSQLLTTLLAKLTALERYEDFLQRINNEAALGDAHMGLPVKTICPDPTLLAKQLTHIELERLSYIGAEEFVQAFAKDSAQGDSNYKELKKTRNLESYVQWFNRLSYYVATEICKAPKKKVRVRLVEYWIDVAQECYNIGNFNSLMAIIAGLNMAPVARLKKTWNKVCTAQLAMLEQQMDPSANFSTYRSTLKETLWRSVGEERQRIVIPFFSLLVKDLYFLNEDCTSKLPNGYINFERIWQFAKQVTEVLTLQQINCSSPKIKPVLQALNTSPVFSESALCLASYEREAANSVQERERLKYLLKDEASTSSEVSDTSPRKKHFKKTRKMMGGMILGAAGSSSSPRSSSTITPSTAGGYSGGDGANGGGGLEDNSGGDHSGSLSPNSQLPHDILISLMMQSTELTVVHESEVLPEVSNCSSSPTTSPSTNNTAPP